MLGCLNITGLEVALLLNFKDAKLEWKRIVNERNKKLGEDKEIWKVRRSLFSSLSAPSA